MLTLAGRVALVTGGSRGIGRAVALLFGRLGARVALSYVRDVEAARTAVAEVTAAGAEAVALCADLAHPTEADRLVTETLARFGRLEWWGQSGYEPGPAARHTKEWQETLTVNLTGTWAARAAVGWRPRPGNDPHRPRRPRARPAALRGHRGAVPFAGHWQELALGIGERCGLVGF
jgi:NAD(P)-dependent dehydrogenase (short-subunit alcohol dehydrogenase family)